MTRAALLALATRADQLMPLVGIDSARGAGAYLHPNDPRNPIEYLLHELAHLHVAGMLRETPVVYPRRVPVVIGNHIAALSHHTADSEEIDAAIVTHLAGVQLGAWKSPAAIARSCTGNLSGPRANDHRWVLREMRTRRTFDATRGTGGLYAHWANCIVQWVLTTPVPA